MAKTVKISTILSLIFISEICAISNLNKKFNYVNITEHPGELCLRTCTPNDKRICYYQFVLELYQAMGVACGKCAQGILKDCNNPQCIVGDGTEKGVMSINRQIPGPTIHTCQGDLIIIDVVNKAHGSASAIHWHGLHMKNTPFMDGVPYVTQCPNLYGSTFRYWFEAVEPGTHFYHSHSGHHKINGQYGALIVREPEKSTMKEKRFDFDLPEHHIVISDWMHVYGEQLFPGLPSVKIEPDSVLIHGRGIFTDPKTFQRTNMPPRSYSVKIGKRYRFRIINASSHACPMQLQIQNHSLYMMSSDSFDVEPMKFDTIVSNAGERYDIILIANQKMGDFWIRVRGLGACAKKPIESFALLRYVNIGSDTERSQPPYPTYNETYPLGKVLNSPSTPCSDKTDNRCITELVSLEKDEELRTKKPDQQIFLGFNNIKVPNSEIFQPGTYPHFKNPAGSQTYVGAINNISIVFPTSPPLTQPFDINESDFCNEFHLPAHCRGKIYCPCTHRIKIQKNSIVELVVVDEAAHGGFHPFHLHGYRFMVVAVGQHPLGLPMTLKTAKQIHKSRVLAKNYENKRPPFKDTVSIPNRGYLVLRFRADNPGFWAMHCHYEWHYSSGMGLIIQVGNTNDMVKPPPDFPKCKNYLPKIKMPKY